MRIKPVLLIAACCLGGQLFAQKTKPQHSVASTATFTIYMGHGNHGTETYTVNRTGNRYLLTSTVHLREYGERIFSEQKQELAADWTPMHYSLKTEMGGQKRTTEALVGNGKVQMRSASGSDVKNKTIDLRSPALVFDSVVPSQFQVLINEYNALHARQPLDFQMLVPQVMAEFSGTVSPSGSDKGTLNNRPVELREYTLASRGAHLQIWTDHKGDLMRVSLPIKKTEFIRAGFKMVGIPEPSRPKSVVMLH